MLAGVPCSFPGSVDAVLQAVAPSSVLALNHVIRCVPDAVCPRLGLCTDAGPVEVDDSEQAPLTHGPAEVVEFSGEPVPEIAVLRRKR